MLDTESATEDMLLTAVDAEAAALEAVAATSEAVD